MAYARAWLIAFIFTQMVEMPIYATGLRVSLLAAFGASALTHPVLWFILFPHIRLPYMCLVVLAEAFAVLAEAGYFALILSRRKPRSGAPTKGTASPPSPIRPYRRALLWSVIANAASFGTGMLSRSLFGVP